MPSLFVFVSSNWYYSIKEEFDTDTEWRQIRILQYNGAFFTADIKKGQSISQHKIFFYQVPTSWKVNEPVRTLLSLQWEIAPKTDEDIGYRRREKNTALKICYDFPHNSSRMEDSLIKYSEIALHSNLWNGTSEERKHRRHNTRQKRKPMRYVQLMLRCGKLEN